MEEILNSLPRTPTFLEGLFHHIPLYKEDEYIIDREFHDDYACSIRDICIVSDLDHYCQMALNNPTK